MNPRCQQVVERPSNRYRAAFAVESRSSSLKRGAIAHGPSACFCQQPPCRRAASEAIAFNRIAISQSTLLSAPKQASPQSLAGSRAPYRIPAPLFLISARRIATAGHCVATDIARTFVLGFAYDRSPNSVDQRNAPLTIDISQRFLVRRRIASNYNFSRADDWAVLELEREVPRDIAKPLTLRARHPAQGRAVRLIGHPLGMPLKFSDGSVVGWRHDDTVIASDIYSFGGFSGAPIFDRDGGYVVALMSQYVVPVLFSEARDDCQVYSRLPAGDELNTGRSIDAVRRQR